jgi:predicted TIM-barrel fold metal-dependent hydrolase
VSRWRRRLAQEPDREPLLPLVPGPLSNGEFVPDPPSARDEQVRRAALRRAAEAADRIGMDRRRFLQTSGGVAAVLATYNLAACSGGSDAAAPATTSTTSTTAGGTFVVPEPEETAACESVLGSQGELIVDVHTHHVVPDGPWRQNAARIVSMVRGLVPAGCTEDDPFRCLDRTAYLHDMFLASDTTVTLLSDVPGSGPDDYPLPWEAKQDTRVLAGELSLGGARRVYLHDVIAPNFGPLQARLDDMARTVASGQVSAFKVYTAWGPGRRGFSLADPAIGLPVVEQARSLGVKVICAHKGLPLVDFDLTHNGPDDLVSVARQYPDMQFVVYHSAFERAITEHAYRPATRGVDSLVKALDDHGIPPNANVWCELGTTWRETLGNPTEAAHVLGKLLTRVGQDRVLWGTDAIWYGSPQPQIMAFRAFQISAELQERHGYPALTDELKRKVLGGNAVNLLGIDAEVLRCGLDADRLTAARAEHASLVTEGAVTPWQPRGPITRREVVGWLASARAPWTP